MLSAGTRFSAHVLCTVGFRSAAVMKRVPSTCTGNSVFVLLLCAFMGGVGFYRGKHDSTLLGHGHLD